MKLSHAWNRGCDLRLNDLLTICFFGRLRSTPSSLYAGSGTEKCGQRNGRAVKLVLVLRAGRTAMGAQVSCDLFQRRRTRANAGVLHLAILYTLDPRLDSRALDWYRRVVLLQRLE